MRCLGGDILHYGNNVICDNVPHGNNKTISNVCINAETIRFQATTFSLGHFVLATTESYVCDTRILPCFQGLDSMPRNRQTCHWADCRRVFNDPEALLEHLSDDHVGRRSTNNLCLECKWNDCGATAAKRDHLVSHLKVHLPFKRESCRCTISMDFAWYLRKVVSIRLFCE